MKRWKAIVAIVVSLMVGGAIGSSGNHPTDCPTEDSCAYVYHDHHGYVEHIVP